jgi:hypothetical protein
MPKPRPATKQERRPRRLRPFKMWGVVSETGGLCQAPSDVSAEELTLIPLAIYPRRYMAAVAASLIPGGRVVPLEVRSLQHRPR